MSSRIIRGDDRLKKLKVRGPGEIGIDGVIPQDHAMHIEKQAFEQGYLEGERIGKQMGEKIMEAVCKRYENAIVEFAQSQRSLIAQMEEQTARLALEISRKIVQRELSLDPDLIAALASVALKRVQMHQSIAIRVSRQDFDRVRAAVAAVNPAVTIQDDSTLDRGDFVVDTSQTHLDGRIASQIDLIGRVLLHE